ncbi:MAG: FMN-binding protein [Lachnospiraceae bacterium]
MEKSGYLGESDRNRQCDSLDCVDRVLPYDKRAGTKNASDGIYEGDCDVGYIYAKVAVEIQKNKIRSIRILEHRNERGKPAEQMADAVKEKQRLDVDAVSGATNSSKVIKKAIENAVKKAS